MVDSLKADVRINIENEDERNTLKNQIFSRLHLWVNRFSENLGKVLDKIGVKSKIKKLIRSL